MLPFGLTKERLLSRFSFKGSALPAALFLALSLIKYGAVLYVTAVVRYPSDRLPNGDAYDYVPRAAAMVDHWQGRPAPLERPAQYRDPLGPFENTVTVRPPGYPFLIAMLMAFGRENRTVNVTACLLNAIADMSLTTAAFLLCMTFCASLPLRCVFATLVAVQPWTSANLTLIVPDNLAAALAFFGIGALALYVHAEKPLRALLLLSAGSGILSAAFLLRPEMIVWVPLLTAAALLMRRQAWKKTVAHGGVASLFFLAFLGICVADRYGLEGKLTPFRRFDDPRPGLWAWTQTFSAPEPVKCGILFLWYKGENFPVSELPAQAFDDDGQRARVEEIYGRIRRQGRMMAADDAALMEIARERIQRHPLRYRIAVPLRNFFLEWFDPGNPFQPEGIFFRVLRALLGTADARPVSLFFRAIVLLLFLGDLLLLLGNGLRRRSSLAAFFTLGSLFAVTRPALFAFYHGYVEARYMVPVWPFILVMACHGIARLAEWRAPAHHPPCRV